MSEERRKILDMLAAGKINVDEAEKLLAAISDQGSSQPEGEQDESSGGKPNFKYLRIMVEPGPDSEKQEKVNIRVPSKLIRAGLKWAAFMPKHTRTKVNKALNDKGIDTDFDKMSVEDIEDLVTHLDDLTIDVEGKEKIRIFCE